MPVIQPSEIAARILDGQNIVIYRSNVLKIPDSWLAAHPGGSLSILHFVGRDATDEMDAYHGGQPLREKILKYSIGTVDGVWNSLVAPIAVGWVRKGGKWQRDMSVDMTHDFLLVQQTASDDVEPSCCGPTLESITPKSTEFSEETRQRQSLAYQVLHQRIIDAGLYSTPYISGYGPEVLRYLFLAFCSAFAYYKNWQITSAVCLGFLWHQLSFLAHDLGHMGVSHNWVIDRLIGILVANTLGGLSIGWWVYMHNVHHLVTNHPCHDPDIEHLPFFAISPAFFSNLYSTYYKRTMSFDRFSKFVISFQHKLFYIVLAFGRFNLYALSFGYLFSGGQAVDGVAPTKAAKGGKWAWRLEVFGILFFWTWFAAVVYGCGTWQKAVIYVVVSHVVTSPLHVQLVLSHFTMSTADLGPSETWFHRQLRTTCDVICPPSMEFFHGGLHLQVTHHLFPRLPRHNLKPASAMVKQFAKEEGLTYAEFGFIDGNKEVVGVLRNVAHQVELMLTVADVEIKEAVDKKLAAKSSTSL